MDTALAKLRPFNLAAGLLHLASFAAILILANNASLPVRATYLNGPPGSDKFGEPTTLFAINIGHAVAGFLLISAFFHFLIITPTMFGRYTGGLRENRNTFRWVEYSMSSSIMIVLILQLNGIADYAALIGLFFVNAAMILFGWLQERYATPGNGDMLPFIFGSIVGSVPWIVITIHLIGPGNDSDVTVPGFVWGIIVSLFVFFNCFAVVQWLQYRAKGKWSNYLRGERAYIVLSLVAKTALAWQVYSGALASS